MKKLIALCLLIGIMASMAVSAHAADSTFVTEGKTDYYKSTCYEDYYDSVYNYGGMNAIDFDIPEIRYGLADEFLETSLDNSYLGSGIRYGIAPTGSDIRYGTELSDNVSYPPADYGNAVVSIADPIRISYTPSVTADQLKQNDGSLGTVSVSRVGLYAKVFEGATNESMAKGAGHYVTTGCWNGNVGLFGHNRGGSAYFAQLKDVRIGDTVTYVTNQGTRMYEVQFVGAIDYTDHSYLNETGDNRITLITCIANQPSLRLCVQAVEIH